MIYFHDIPAEERDALEKVVMSLEGSVPLWELHHMVDLWRSSAWSLEELIDEVDYVTGDPAIALPLVESIRELIEAYGT